MYIHLLYFPLRSTQTVLGFATGAKVSVSSTPYLTLGEIQLGLIIDLSLVTLVHGFSILVISTTSLTFYMSLFT